MDYLLTVCLQIPHCLLLRQIPRSKRCTQPSLHVTLPPKLIPGAPVRVGLYDAQIESVSRDKRSQRIIHRNLSML